MGKDAATKAMEKLANEDKLAAPASDNVAQDGAAIQGEVQESSLVVIPGYGTPEKALGDYVSALGLSLPEDLNYTDWELVGTGIRTFREAGSWIVGDFLNYGIKAFGEDVASQVVDSLGYDEHTLSVAKYTSNAIPMSERRQNLSYRHHQCVASMDSEERGRWLDQAEEGNWSSDTLRDKIREAKGKEKGTQGRGRPKGTTKASKVAKARAEAMSMIQMVAFIEQKFAPKLSDAIEEMIAFAKLSGPMLKEIQAGEGLTPAQAKSLLGPIDQTSKKLAQLREDAAQIAAFSPPKEEPAKKEAVAKAPKKAKKVSKKSKAAASADGAAAEAQGEATA